MRTYLYSNKAQFIRSIEKSFTWPTINIFRVRKKPDWSNNSIESPSWSIDKTKPLWYKHLSILYLGTYYIVTVN